ncbi:MAG: hypothetical protein AAGA54_03750 [Myxococcota bacterium]
MPRSVWLLAAAMLGGCAAHPAASQDLQRKPSVYITAKAAFFLHGIRAARVAVDRTDPTGSYRRLRSAAEAWEQANPGALRPVIQADDTVPTRLVELGLGALSQGCEQPALARLAPDSPPRPIGIGHFHGCRAVHPLQYCDSPRVYVGEQTIQLKRVATLLGENCAPGAAVLRSPGDERPDAPPTSTFSVPTEQLPAVVDALASSYEGLPPCPDLHVEVGPDARWGETRRVLTALAPMRPHVTLHVEWGEHDLKL